MEFNALANYPIIFVIKDEYEIFLNGKNEGLFVIKINGKNYYENNNGVLSTTKKYARIRVPQSELNSNPKYQVIFLKNIVRTDYFSKLESGIMDEFIFSPLKKKNVYNIYHFGDVHRRYDEWKNAASYFENNIDFYVSNGDIAEVNSINEIYDSINFHSEISKGKYPIIFARGNHDTRGKMPEMLVNYFPNENGNFYYEFNLGKFKGIVLDCGEDKYDFCEEYGGNEFNGERFNINNFHDYRRKELNFLKSLSGNYDFVVCHICFNTLNMKLERIFDIENDLYTEWAKELARLNVKFLLSAHEHKYYFFEKHHKNTEIDNTYAILIGTVKTEDNVYGSAIRLSKNELNVDITDKNKEILISKTFNFMEE